MPDESIRPGRRGPHMKHVHFWVHEEIYNLMADHCPVTPRGRHMGMSQLVTQCVLLVLGNPKRRRMDQGQ